MKATKLLITFLCLWSLDAYSQTYSLVFEFAERFKTYKNLSDGTFTIKNEKGKNSYSKLKFVGHLGPYLQILDRNNRMHYLDGSGNKTNVVSIHFGLCGTVPNHVFEIIESDCCYIVTDNENFYDYGDVIPPAKIDSIPKGGISDIYFANRKKTIEVNGNDFVFSHTKTFPQAVIIEKNGVKGIWYNSAFTIFDGLQYDYGIFKVERNNLYGYFGITAVKYKTLRPYEHALAPIKTVDGRTGYIDGNGKEYF